MRTPNIFKYARSSTLNIAMIGWILDHINCEGNLKELGLEMVKTLSENKIQNVESIKILNMYKNIALVAEVNKDYVIAIEDITFAKNQSNILKKHREIIIKDENYIDRKKIFVYIHIGNKTKSDSCIKNDEYTNIGLRRTKILDLIKAYRNQDSLLDDYLRYLEVIDEHTEKYRENPEFKYWHRLTWEGYFNKFKEEVSDKDLDWDYSSSQNGDLISFAWNKKEKKYITTLDVEVDYRFYLQIESELPCKYNYEEHKHRPYILIKVEVNDNKYKSEIRNYVWSKLEEIKDKYEKQGLYIEKTSHAIGKYMTIGKISDFEKLDDLEKNLKIAEDLLKELYKIC